MYLFWCPRQRASPVAAVCDRRKQTQLGAQRRKLPVEALCERLCATIRQSQTAATRESVTLKFQNLTAVGIMKAGDFFDVGVA